MHMTFIILILAYLIFTNLVTYCLFAHDKRCAIEKRRRIPEATLLFWASIGGWLGAKIAQHRLRHKTYKQPFGRHLNAIGVLHALIALALAVNTVSFFSTPPASKKQLAEEDTHLLISLRPPMTRPNLR